MKTKTKTKIPCIFLDKTKVQTIFCEKKEKMTFLLGCCKFLLNGIWQLTKLQKANDLVLCYFTKHINVL